MVSTIVDTTFDVSVADAYRSPSQRARCLTEDWFSRNGYCPACPSDTVVRTANNAKAVDFLCTSCGAEYQLKSKAGVIAGKVRDAAYAPMCERVLAGTAPHFALLRYDRVQLTVRDLLFVPSHFITLDALEQCRPLAATARRAGWVGCNLLLHALPPDAMVAAISGGNAVERATVRRQWARFSWLAGGAAEARGWVAEVLQCVRRIGDRRFTLAEMYAFEEHLARRHPSNQNVRPKIRQQLQVLRDQGILRFLGHGIYEPVP